MNYLVFFAFFVIHSICFECVHSYQYDSEVYYEEYDEDTDDYSDLFDSETSDESLILPPPVIESFQETTSPEDLTEKPEGSGIFQETTSLNSITERPESSENFQETTSRDNLTERPESSEHFQQATSPENLSERPEGSESFQESTTPEIFSKTTEYSDINQEPSSPESITENPENTLETTTHSMPHIIRCNFESEYYGMTGWIYECKVEGDLIINSQQTAIIDSVTGLLHEDKTTKDVTGFVANEKSARHFPRGLEKIFGGIKLIHMKHSNLVELHQSDLEYFRYLLEIDLHDNEIAVIEKGLFDYNPNVEYISISKNKLIEIHPQVFDKLIHLSSLFLSDNVCIDDGTYQSSNGVHRIIGLVKKQCIGSNTLEEESSTQKSVDSDEYIETTSSYTSSEDELPETTIAPTNSKSFDLKCDFYKRHYGVAGWIYQCTINYEINILSQDETTIGSVSGLHDDEKNNKNVNGFVANLKNIRHFPRGLENFFGSIELIHMQDGYLEEIHQYDLKPFPDLVELNFHNCELKIIEEGLFDYNTKIKYLSLSNNKISSIHPKVFDKLNDLSSLYLNQNQCMNRGCYDDMSTVKDIIKTAKEQCNDEKSSSEEPEAPEETTEIDDKSSLQISCNYNYKYFGIVGYIDICVLTHDLDIHSNEESAFVKSVSGVTSDVAGFVADGRSVRYFPRGLENFFDHLQLIHMKECNLQEIEQSDLKPFTNLIEIDLEHNEIKFIAENLFEYNPKLQFISFSNNKINMIYPRVFDNLQHLNSLYLYKNECIDDGYYKDSDSVKKLINEANRKCSGVEVSLGEVVTKKPDSSSEENSSSEEKINSDSVEDEENNNSDSVEDEEEPSSANIINSNALLLVTLSIMFTSFYVL